jgi:ABC-2 type transport system ATP-binding protein
MVHEQRIFEGFEGYRSSAKKPPTAQEVQDALAGLPGAGLVTELPTDDKAHRFQFHAPGGTDIRPEIFSMIVQKGWLLLEMRRDGQTLEDVFKSLTKGDERKDRGRKIIDEEDEEDESTSAAAAITSKDDEEDDEGDEEDESDDADEGEEDDEEDDEEDGDGDEEEAPKEVAPKKKKG